MGPWVMASPFLAAAGIDLMGLITSAHLLRRYPRITTPLTVVEAVVAPGDSLGMSIHHVPSLDSSMYTPTSQDDLLDPQT